MGNDGHIASLFKKNIIEKSEKNVSYVKRKDDTRSLDEKIYKLRVVIPKELTNAKNPESGFIIQESSTTGIRTDGALPNVCNSRRSSLLISVPATTTSSSQGGVKDFPSSPGASLFPT